ncbi:hypothetical protein UFOVP448_19 [uncultured Caudovirales phage]|uniref:Uncharacterized protein n=1 Tax=uncultured Caudovirales phage TaxID=2100421 RepID=A0A6J5M6E0_9CAUD|nr:hypothetical protein UFOVP448_19 [uncultured Caudovirales phage]
MIAQHLEGTCGIRLLSGGAGQSETCRSKDTLFGFLQILSKEYLAIEPRPDMDRLLVQQLVVGVLREILLTCTQRESILDYVRLPILSQCQHLLGVSHHCRGSFFGKAPHIVGPFGFFN